MVLPGARLLLVCGDLLPPLELEIQVLGHLSEDVDVKQVIIEDSVLVLAAKTQHSVVLELVAIGGVEIVGLDDLVAGDAFVGRGLVADGEDERVEEGATSEGDEDEVLVELLLLVDAAADHDRAPEERGGVVLDVEPTPRTQPLAALQVEHQQLRVEPLPLLPLETHPAHDHQVPAVDLDCVEAGRNLRPLAGPPHLRPLPRLLVVAVEEGEALEAALVEAAKQVDLFVCAEEGGIVADGGEEGVEAAVGEREQAEGALDEGVLVALYRRRLYLLLTLVLDLLQLGDPALEVPAPAGLRLRPQVLAEGPVQLAVVMHQRILQLLPARLHPAHDVRQLLRLPPLRLLEEGLGVGASVDGLETVHRGRLPQELLDCVERVAGGEAGGLRRLPGLERSNGLLHSISIYIMFRIKEWE